ncbi:unnamed protein product [Cyprideis torosa]|uniref:LisH domain-containing protein n=1 Tax=Cyprideis torosa TaxID=163714 RepID=A0A7R8ZJZ7_9CRUS|nr:unnamed protein product [Cyprideis torosa]CAG0879249.1 unnamed protein product [Cyprideis torosa]
MCPNMYAKGKGSTAPSDAQAREKLALYVYEYLLHVGAQKAAQTFLSEIRWEKNITLGEPPGFLHSWWCVFWDLYCAAPERRDNCEHSSEAKAFHDYGFVNSGYGVNGIAHLKGLKDESAEPQTLYMCGRPIWGLRAGSVNRGESLTCCFEGGGNEGCSASNSENSGSGLLTKVTRYVRWWEALWNPTQDEFQWCLLQFELQKHVLPYVYVVGLVRGSLIGDVGNRNRRVLCPVQQL